MEFENNIFRKIFGLERKEKHDKGEKNEDSRDLYKDPDTVAIAKSKSLSWAEHVYLRGI